MTVPNGSEGAIILDWYLLLIVTELSSLLNTNGMIWRVWNVMIVLSPASDKRGNRDKKQKEEKKKDEDFFAADI